MSRRLQPCHVCKKRHYAGSEAQKVCQQNRGMARQTLGVQAGSWSTEAPAPVAKQPELVRSWSEVDAGRMDELNSRIQKINDRLESLGSEGRVEITNTQRSVNSWGRVSYNVELSVPSHESNGWTMKARVDNVGDTDSVTVHKASSAARDVDMSSVKPDHCDHCGTRRQRKTHYLLEHEDGTVMQIGSSCLSDFQGGFDPGHFVTDEDLDELSRDLTHTSNDQGVYDAKTVLTSAIRLMKDKPYVPVSNKQPGTSSTHDLFMQGAVTQYDDSTPEERAEADRVIEWMSAGHGDQSDYRHNLSSCTDTVGVKHTALTLSAVSAYRREMARNQEKAAREKAGTAHYGEVGEKFEPVEMTYTGCRTFDGRYGIQRYISFQGPNGESILWKTGGNATSSKIMRSVEDGQRKFTVKGKVKDHGEYRGEPQTGVSHLSLVG